MEIVFHIQMHEAYSTSKSHLLTDYAATAVFYASKEQMNTNVHGEKRRASMQIQVIQASTNTEIKNFKR